MADISDIVFCHAYTLRVHSFFGRRISLYFWHQQCHFAGKLTLCYTCFLAMRLEVIRLEVSNCREVHFFFFHLGNICVYIPQNNLIFPKRKKKSRQLESCVNLNV